MCVTSGIVPAVTYARLCAHTNTINSSSWKFSNVRVNQTQLWHQVRNLKDNRQSVRVWNVKDNADIFDFETEPRDRAITQERWLLLSPDWDNCCAHEKLDEDVFIWVTSDWHITAFIITSEVYDELQSGVSFIFHIIILSHCIHPSSGQVSNLVFSWSSTLYMSVIRVHRQAVTMVTTTWQGLHVKKQKQNAGWVLVHI